MIDRDLNFGRQAIRRHLQAAAPFGSILDIGAGRGADLAMAKEASPQAKRFALESFGPNVEELKRQGVEVHPTNLEHDPFPFMDEFFDVVMGNQIFEHVKEVFWILHQISRTLKVGGHLIIGVPNLAALHNRILLAAGRQPSSLKNNSAHVRGYTKNDFIRLVNSGFEGGYELKGFAGSNFYPFPPSVARVFAALLPSMAWGIFFRFQKTKAYRGEFLNFPIKEQLETNFFVG